MEAGPSFGRRSRTTKEPPQLAQWRQVLARCPDWDVEAELRRHAAFRAALLRRDYDAGWLPESVARDISNIGYDDRRSRVVVLLRTGTRIMDEGDRVTFVGRASDVSVDELVEGVRRRSWDAVEVEGSLEFRREIALRLALLDPAVVVADDPLTEAERVEVACSWSSGTDPARPVP
jgi:hypothetical protein